MKFHLETMDQYGREKTIDIEAKDEDEACKIARQKGFFVTKVKVVARSSGDFLSMEKEAFWRQCSEKGISICKVHNSMGSRCNFLVEKHPTHDDKNKWRTSHTFDTMEEACLMTELYLLKGVEPQFGVPKKSFWSWLFG